MKVKYFLLFCVLSVILCSFFVNADVLCYDETNENRVLDRQDLEDDCNNNKKYIYSISSSSSWLTHSSQCQLFFSNKKLFANFIISPGNEFIDWTWDYHNQEFRTYQVNTMNSIYQATKNQPNGEAILKANLYMKTNITYYLINSTINSEIYPTTNTQTNYNRVKKRL